MAIKTFPEIEREIKRLQSDLSNLFAENRLLRERINHLSLDDGSVQLSPIIPSSAPVSAQYLTLELSSLLTNERRFVPYDGLTGTDGGANADYNVSIDLSANSGLEFTGTAPSRTLQINLATNSGLTLSGGPLAMGTPSSVYAGSPNQVASGTHTHGVTSSSDGAANLSTILQSDANGDLFLRRLYVDDRIIHDGDPNTYLELTSDLALIHTGGQDAFRARESGVNSNITIGGGTSYDMVAIATNVIDIDHLLRHRADIDTYLEFTTDRVQIRAGGAVFLDLLNDVVQDSITLGPGSGDVDINFNGDMFLVGSSGKFGIRTSTIPHGGVGAARLALEGTDSSTDGPHVQFTTPTDDYPLLQILNWQHDNINLSFDAYYDGSWRSSDPGSNFQFRKANDRFEIQRGSGVIPGGIIYWTRALTITTMGYVGINAIPQARLHSRTTTTINEALRLETVDATGNPSVTFYQNGTWRSFVQHLDAGDMLQVGSRYGGLQLATGTLGSPSVKVTVDTSGTMFVGVAATNAQMTRGITVDQDTATGQALAVKHNNVGHLMTGLVEADTYGWHDKYHNDLGGYRLEGISENQYGLILSGTAQLLSNSWSALAEAPIMLESWVRSGSNRTSTMTSNQICVVFRRGAITLGGIDEDGDFYSETGAYNTFDGLDDVQILRVLSREVAGKGVIKSEFDKFLKYNREDLTKFGLTHFNDSPEGDGSIFVNWTQTWRLMLGGMWQQELKIRKLEEALRKAKLLGA